MRLTDLTVPKLRPGIYMDDRTPDFGIRVGKKRRTWIAIVGRGRVKTALGHFPSLKLADARTEARRLLTTEPERKAPAVSFQKARDAFLATYENPRTQYQVKRSLERHFGPLAGMPVSDITHEHIERCLARLKDRPSEQLHAFRNARALFNWCVKAPRRWVKISPMYGYDAPVSEKRGTRTLTDDELVRIWYAAPAIFRLMILWGTRNSETCVLEREWITDGVLTIPGAHTKNGRDHAIPLCPLAEHLLAGPSNQYVFPGRWEGHISPGALGKLKREVMEKSGTNGWQLRDIRRTFRTNLRRLGVPVDVCEVLINHAPATLHDIYDRYHLLPEKRAALAKHETALVWLLARV